MKCFSAYNKNEEIRIKSSSGGIFTSVAEYYLKNDGIVYGVAMSDDNYFAEFKRVDKIEGLSELRGSKYFQAKISTTYQQVKKDLLQNTPVLFTGTGCQINGLKLYLQKEYDNLFVLMLFVMVFHHQWYGKSIFYSRKANWMKRLQMFHLEISVKDGKISE